MDHLYLGKRNAAAQSLLPPNGAPADSVPNNSPLLAVLESLHRSGKKPLELEWLFFLMAVSIWATKQLTEHLFLTNPEADQDFAA